MPIDRIGAGVATAYPRSASPATRGPQGTSFADALSKASENLQISRHAQKRIERRQLDIDPAGMVRLNSAISRAAEKGGRNSLVMLDDLAVLVNVRERTVVTAMPAEGGHQRVFTNIDSVVIA